MKSIFADTLFSIEYDKFFAALALASATSMVVYIIFSGAF